MRVGQARRKYGWAPAGQPAFVRQYGTHGHAESFSAIATLGLKGIRHVICYENGVNAETFMDALLNHIIPTMGQRGEPFSCLILDNASVHDHDAIYAAVQAHGADVLFLPPYSYDYNPIEVCIFFFFFCLIL